MTPIKRDAIRQLRRHRPLLLDAFCKAGGAGMGYHRAGFLVVGVDIEPQPRYPFQFVQDDALTFVSEMGWLFQAFHGSPPCQDHSSLRSRAGVKGTGWLLAATRKAFEATGKPWVIENVPGAPMRRDAVYCGEMFGLRTVRHRWFESNVPITAPSHPPRHARKTSAKNRVTCLAKGHNISITGNVGRHVGVPCMGISWMTGSELSQAVPPAYTEHLGLQLITAVRP